MRYAVAVILIIVFAIVAIVFLGRATNTGTSRSNATASRVTKLADYADNDASSVSWTMQGRLLGEDQFRSVRITVTRHSRTLEILDGYKLVPTRQQDYGNTPEAFQAFTRALDLANFGKERDVKLADERGVCPLGNRYIYRLSEGGSEVMRTWSDSCLTSDGPFSGNPTLIAQLFKNQITDYTKLTSGIVF